MSTISNITQKEAKMPPTLSIITISNGDRSQIEVTSSSIPADKDVEWIVVTAKTEFGPEFQRANKILYGSRNGIFFAMNQGLSKASGDICIFMNAGDAFSSTFQLQKILNSYAIHQWNWLVGDAMHQVNQKWRKWKIPNCNSWRFKTASRSFCHQSTFIQTSILRKLGGYDENSYISDWLCSMQLSLISAPFKIDELVAIIEPAGISSKFSFRYRVSEPHRLRVKNKLIIINSIYDYWLQIISVLSADLIRIGKKVIF
jgi:glycosyltransferase involved in cell wall biosynthesis